ncbi:TPA: WxL domain-containing protein [Enterococcus faecium]
MKLTNFMLVGMTLLSASVLNSTQIFAEAGPIPADRETKAQVKFIEDDSKQPPVDPTDPDTDNPQVPVDPTDPDKPVDEGTNGPLSLDYASILDFGEQLISTKDQTYYAAPQLFRGADGSIDDSHPVPLYTQVTDKRGGEQGWTLSVKQNGQFVSDQNGKELTGAEITFTAGNVYSYSESAKPGNVQSEFTLIPDGSGSVQNVVEASEGEGFGTWVYRFGESAEGDYDAVQLSVPGSTVKEKDTYTTSLTWTLNDIPANDNDTPDNGDAGSNQ